MTVRASECGGTSQERAAALSAFDPVYQGQIDAWRDSRYVDYPHQVGIESQAVCNATCDFCPYPSMSRKGERMEDALIEKILSELEEMPRDLEFDVSFSRMNEPFVDRRVMDVAMEVNRRLPQANLWFFTNASPLVPKVAARLEALSRVTQFVVSFNDHREAEYERVMGLPFARTIANLDALHEKHTSGDLGFTPLISRVGDGSDADDSFIAWCQTRWPGFEARVTQRFDWIGSLSIRTFGSIPAIGCWQWFHLPILASGRVAYCTLDHEGERSYGDVRERHVLEIYNDPARRRLRTEALTRLDVGVCSRCNHYG